MEPQKRKLPQIEMLLLWPKSPHQKEMLHKRSSSGDPVTQGVITKEENTKEKGNYDRSVKNNGI